ncbi:MAG: hypothetical protein KatS3mg115_1858 [Candidatus Poribacteria bacterium]|nr:MAG: hypothetical protein KatS3mg115_1858 [Candidatus Poribacteria bacterium]
MSAGESTGGVIVPQLQRTTDGIAAAAVILSGMVRRGEPLSEWVGRWPRFWMRRAKLPLPEGFSVERVYQTVAELYPGAAVERIDGLKLLLDERAWVSVRPSGTEPVVRVFAEADDPARADELVRRTAQAVRRVLDSTV